MVYLILFVEAARKLPKATRRSKITAKVFCVGQGSKSEVADDGSDPRESPCSAVLARAHAPPVSLSLSQHGSIPTPPGGCHGRCAAGRGWEAWLLPHPHGTDLRHGRRASMHAHVMGAHVPLARCRLPGLPVGVRCGLQ